jgi:hypothetical protein
VALNERKLPAQVVAHNNALRLQLALQEHKNVANDLVDIEPGSVFFLPVEHGPDAFDHIAGTVPVLDDSFERRARRVEIRRRPRQKAQSSAALLLPSACAEVPKADELAPVATELAPTAVFLVPAPLAFAWSPSAILLLPLPLALACRPTATLFAVLPLALAPKPDATLLLKLLPLALANAPVATLLLLLLPLALERSPTATLSLLAPLALAWKPLAILKALFRSHWQTAPSRYWR